ncbi:MAG TPA: HAMP domain-containing protein, partial [Paenibacillus sp.]|nr:HAMP domain-containing protein [Paenibacillus sp.]
MTRIQKKIWTLAAVVVSMMAAIWLGLTFYNQKTQDQYNDILQRYLRMNEATIASQRLVASLNDYLLSPTPQRRRELQTSKEAMGEAKSRVLGLRNVDNDFELSNYVHLIDSLVEAADRSLLFREENDAEGAGRAFSEASRVSMYISEMTLTLIDKELETYDRFYRSIIERSEALNRLGFWLLLLIMFALGVFVYWFSLSITRPVLTLIGAAQELSRGRFDLKIEVSSNDEMSFLARMFDRMRVNINNLIVEIQEKAQLEKELQ